MYVFSPGALGALGSIAVFYIAVSQPNCHSQTIYVSLVELHWEGSALQPAQQACLDTYQIHNCLLGQNMKTTVKCQTKNIELPYQHNE